jgi:spore photoproduct lyase
VLGEIDRVLFEPEAADSDTARRLTDWARAAGVEVTVGIPPEVPDVVGRRSSKRSLRLTRHTGAALRPCTGRTDSLLCCNLHVVTQVVGCPLDCSYCILQQYQNSGEIIVRVDPHDILDGVAAELARQPRRLFRVCTGQVADSLALEPEIGFAAAAVERFAALENGVLELKTKTDRVDHLLSLPHGGRTIVSWSLNPPDVALREEHGAAPIAARLAAARRAVDAGFLVAFHLDPMVTEDGEPGPHLALLELLADAVPPRRVAYLSLGTVRFHPTMRRTMADRLTRSRSVLAELLPDVDGKLRLLSPLRVALYREVAARARALFPEVFLYLCMEPARVWRQALGTALESRSAVELALAASLHVRFDLAPCHPEAVDYPE